MFNFELIIDFIIIVLLVPTIIYAYRLNKNLNILRANQNSMAKLIESLNEATFKAERSIPKLKSVTENSSEGLKEVIESAKNLKDDLIFINDRANNLADRLEGVIRDTKISTINVEQKYAENEEKSLAEVELLQALRSIK